MAGGGLVVEVAVRRRRFTEAEKAEVWEKREAGEPTRSIARRLGREASGIRRLFEDAGGVHSAVRRRSRRHFSLTEREEISREVAAGESVRVIASRLGRAPSTVSREVTRNGGPGLALHVMTISDRLHSALSLETRRGLLILAARIGPDDGGKSSLPPLCSWCTVGSWGEMGFRRGERRGKWENQVGIGC